MDKSIKVLEFKANFTSEEITTLHQWQEGLRRLWNFLLSEIEILETYSYGGRPACPLPWRTWYNKNLPDTCDSLNDDDRKGLCCDLVDPRSKWITRNSRQFKNVTPNSSGRCEIKDPTREVATSAKLQKMVGWEGGWGYSCPAKVWVEPSIWNLNPQGKLKNEPYTTPISQLIRESVFSTHPRLGRTLQEIKSGQCAISNTGVAKYREAVMTNLTTAYKAYQKSRRSGGYERRGKPKYKSKREGCKTISHYNPNSGSKASNHPVQVYPEDLLKIPKLSTQFGKYYKVKGLNKRWGNRLVKTFHLIEKADSWYVQLAGEIEKAQRSYKRPKKISGWDFGRREDNWMASDRGKIAKPRWNQAAGSKVAKLQQQIDRARMHRLAMWLSSATPEIVREVVRHCADSTVEKLLQVRSVDDLGRLASNGEVSGRVLQKLKWNLPPSNRERTNLDRLRRSHEKNARRRKAFIQKQTTFIARKYQNVLAEDGLQQARGKVAPILEGDRYEKNGRDRNRRQNAAHLEAATGTTLSLLESKIVARNRRFDRIPMKNTSQECPACGHLHEEMIDILSHPDFNCPNCGYYCHDRDIKVGVLLTVRAFDLGEVAFEDLSREAKRAILYRKTF